LLQRALNQEHRGPQPHARFMRTSCQKIQFHQYPSKPLPPDNTAEQPIPIVVEPPTEAPNAPASSSAPETPKPPSNTSDKENKDHSPKPEKQKKKTNAEKFAERHSKKPLKVGDGKSPKPGKQSKNPERRSRSPGKVAKTPGGNSKFVLFVGPCIAVYRHSC